MTSKTYIEISDLSKAYRANKFDVVEVLKDFCLSIDKGEIISIYGPNGCGKSTILGLIAQIIPKDGGSIRIGGNTPDAGEVGCLFQDYSASLFPWLTCTENISFSLRLQDISKRERKKKVDEIIQQLNITIDLDKYPYQLSGGQQQLVVLARALCNSPSAIVMDEPFSSLDATIRERIRRDVICIIENLGLTAVLVSHNLEDCIVCSKRIVFLTQLPARIYSIENVPLEEVSSDREIYSDRFAEVLGNFQSVARKAQEK